MLILALLAPLSPCQRATGADAEPPAPPPPGDTTRKPDEPTLEQELRREQLNSARELFAAHRTADALFALAMVHNEQGDVEAATRLWVEGLQQPPTTSLLHDRAEILADLGNAWKIQDQPEKAEAALRESLRLKPSRESSCIRLGQLLYGLGRMDDCLASLAEGRAKSAVSMGLRGKALQRLDRFTEAREAFEAALKLDPELAEACYGLSVVCARLGDTQASADYRRRFARLKEQQVAAGREYRATMNPLHTARRSVAMTHTAVAWAWRDQGQAGRAEGLWQRAAELDPEYTPSRFNLLMLYQQTGRNTEAMRACEELVRLEPDNPYHRISLGNLKARQGHLAEAGTAYEDAYRLGPGRAETCFALAQFQFRNSTNLSRASELASKAVSLSPAAPHLYLRSRIAARLGDKQTALETARRACALETGNETYAAWLRTLEQSP